MKSVSILALVMLQLLRKKSNRTPAFQFNLELGHVQRLTQVFKLVTAVHKDPESKLLTL